MIKRERYMSRIRPFIGKDVVTMDEIDMSRDGIRHYDIRDFLLMDSWE